MRVVVTGASRGIGRAIALRLLRDGHDVVVSGRDAAKLEEVCAIFPARAHAVVADLVDAAQREKLVAESKRMLGGIDAFVSSAGIVKYDDALTMNEKDARAQIETNMIAPFLLARSFASEMTSGGAMVFIASTLATSAAPRTLAYSAAKAGLLASMRSFALELGARGIRVNAISPGIVETDMVKVRGDEAMRALLALHPLGRFATPDDIADGVVYLLDATWVTGTDLVIDAGLSLRS